MTRGTVQNNVEFSARDQVAGVLVKVLHLLERDALEHLGCKYPRLDRWPRSSHRSTGTIQSPSSQHQIQHPIQHPIPVHTIQ